MSTTTSEGSMESILVISFSTGWRRRQPVENEMTRIDSILPSDVVVDIAKIDVEGHEPFVIRGMANTIARSPGLRFIIEYNDQFLAPTIPAAQFLNEIRELGFRVCKIQRNLRLELLGPDESRAGISRCC